MMFCRFLCIYIANDTPRPEVSSAYIIIERNLRNMKKQNKDESFNPTFRNTRSRLYQRKASSEFNDYSDSNRHPAQHSGSHWK